MSLLSLPQELLEQICQYFCLHCQKASSHLKSYFSIADQLKTPSKTKSLVALCRTCPVLAHRAQPHLYHRPLGQRFPGFVQTVSECPQLGHSVRHLLVARPMKPRISRSSLSNYISYATWLLERCDHRRDTALYEDTRKSYFDPMFEAVRQSLHLPRSTTFDDEKGALDITFGLSFMPNLIKLEILLGDGWSFRWCLPDSLPCLRELVISEWALPLIPPGDYGDTIRGLLTAAPALERLELNLIIHKVPESETSYLSHANLKELVINRSTIPLPNLHMLMNGFPNLQTFHLGWHLWIGDDWEEPSASTLTDVVLRRKDTLRHLSLHLSEIGDEGGTKLQDLSRMTVLETFHIDSFILMDEYDKVPDDQKIHDILPPSIKEFGLMGKAYKWMYEEVLHLITMRRPHLQKVIVASEDLQKEEWSD